MWDFPRGTLCLREYAAYVVDAALGWGLVPATVLRDGPAGFGAVQRFVEIDPDADIRYAVDRYAEELRKLALFDVVVNNADRKGGHCLIDRRGKLWSVDHGVCFHAEPKLRTVIWLFQDEPVPEPLLRDLTRLLDGLRARRDPLVDELRKLLDADELESLEERVSRVLTTRRYPSPGPGRHVPWPMW